MNRSLARGVLTQASLQHAAQNALVYLFELEGRRLTGALIGLANEFQPSAPYRLTHNQRA